MSNIYSLTGKKILITGASSGIGAQTAYVCNSLGADVVITGRSSEKLERVYSKLNGENNISCPFDLCLQDNLIEFCDKLPLLDGICFAAGITRTLPVKFIKDKDIEEIFNTNLISSIKIINTLIKRKKINNGASIVFIASISANHADVGNSIYSATKGGIISFSRVLALELASKKIRVNCINPGFIKGTGMTQGLVKLTDEQIKLEENNYPLGFGETSDIANGVAYLLSDAAKWVTGTTLTIDGGLTLR
jgi:NAD(P)-dependent dehydrogenase (short-subunit alcohol dehydrogenase family)